MIIPAPQHSYGDWVKDNEKHWKACSCGLKSSENTHQYDDNSDMICNDCGYDRTVQHTHGNGTKQDGQGATCTVNGWKDYYECACGDKANKAAHTDSNNDGKCDTCEYQMSTTPNTPDNPNNTPDNPNNTPDDPTYDKDGLSTGAVVAIVVASVLTAGGGGFCLYWFVIRKKFS